MSALSKAALAAFSTEPPHRSKQRRPPSADARAEAARLRAGTRGPERDQQPVVTDLARYAAAAAGRNTLTSTTPANTEKETNQQ